MPREEEVPSELSLYGSAFEMAQVGVIRAAGTGELLWLSPTFAGFLGYDSRELIGTNIFDLVLPAVVPVLRERITGMIAKTTPAGSADRQFRHRDGHYVWTNVSGCMVPAAGAVPAHVFGVVINISERKKKEQALRESETRLRVAMESGQIGIWEIDPVTAEAFWSSKFRELLGLPNGVPQSRDAFNERVHPDDRKRVIQEGAEMMAGQRQEFLPFRVVHPDGSVRWLQNIGRPLQVGESGNGKIIGAVLDVTERIEAEGVIEAQRAKITAGSKMSALGEMAGGLAHEINNPVAIIHGNAVLLEQLAAYGKLAPGQTQQIAKIIAQTAERISKITRSLLAFARDADQDPFKRFQIRKLVDETAEFCRERFRGHGVSFEIDPIDPALEVDCRPVQISQVLLNLLNNAHDAVEKLPSRWIRISAREAGDNVEIRVADSGAGIDPSLRDKIFQPFFTTKEVGRGTGLGLSVAAGIVDSHGGSLRVDSAQANTAFSLILPKRQRRMAPERGEREQSRI